jgi:aminoglycoside phosphotransferase (APT) family kinase protein
VIDEIRTLLVRNLPGYEVRSVTGMAEGLDNAAQVVNGEPVVRTSKEADPAKRAASTRREAGLLAAVVKTSTLPVPEPVFADPEAGAIAYRRLLGLPLMDNPVAKLALLAPDLGRFLGRLLGTPLGRMEGLAERDPYPMAAWLEDAEEDYRNISKRLPAEARRQIEGFLRNPPPTETQRLASCHNDLGVEHLFVDMEANAVTGVIDWTDAAITDPARDLALVYRDLGPEACKLALAHYEGSFDGSDRDRAIFYARCKLIKDLAYGFGTVGARRYAEAGLSHLARTFARRVAASPALARPMRDRWRNEGEKRVAAGPVC